MAEKKDMIHLDDIFIKTAEESDVINWLTVHESELRNYKDCNGQTVFHKAVISGRIDILEWLYKNMPELIYCEDKNGDSPVRYAKIYNKTEILEWMRKYIPEIFFKKIIEL